MKESYVFDRKFVCAECLRTVAMPQHIVEWGWNIGKDKKFCTYKCMRACERNMKEKEAAKQARKDAKRALTIKKVNANRKKGELNDETA